MNKTSTSKILKWKLIKNKRNLINRGKYLTMGSFVNLHESKHNEGYWCIDIYSQGEFPGRVWGCRYQLWVVSSCLWFLKHLSANRWTHPVCWQNPARANTQHTGTSTWSNTANVIVLTSKVSKYKNLNKPNKRVLHHNTTNRTEKESSVSIRFNKLIKVSEWGFAFVKSTQCLRECHTVTAVHVPQWFFQ